MERELWSELSAAVAEADASWLEPRRYVHPTAAIVRVHLWAALHDRPVSWACKPAHWLPLRWASVKQTRLFLRIRIDGKLNVTGTFCGYGSPVVNEAVALPNKRPS